MPIHPQVSLSALWALTAWIAGLLAGLDAPQTALALIAIATGQSLIAAGFQKRLSRASSEAWPSSVPVAAILAWVAISLLIVVAALASRTVAALLALGLMYWALRTGRTRSYISEERMSAWNRGACMVGLVGASLALYAAYPALRAANTGYVAYAHAIWIDAPFHASYVAALSDALTNGVYADVHGHGLPTQLYHLGVYAIPALLKALTGADSLALTQVFTAWSGFWLAIAIYAVAACLASRPIVAAPAALLAFALPDAGQLPGGHPLFGTHWLLHVANATATGLAIALVAVATMIHACRVRSWQLILLAWCMTLTVVAFKAQLFILIAVPLFVLPSLLLPGLTGTRRVLIVGVQLALIALVTWLASFSANLPLVRLDFSSGAQWLAAVTPNAPAWTKPLAELAASWTQVPQLIANLMLFGAWMFSGWVLVWLIVRIITRGSQTPRSGRTLLGITAACVAMVLGLATDNRNATGGPLEVHLQAQVFTYICFAMWAALAVAERLTTQYGNAAAVMSVMLAVTAFMWASAWTQPIQRNTPTKVPTLHLAPDAAAVTALRASLNKCDVIFVADGDRFMAWQAALERPVWVTDYAFNPKHRAEVTMRINEWTRRAAPLETWLAARGITVFILPVDTPPSLAEAPSRAPDFNYPNFRAWRIPAQRPCPSS